MVLALTRSVPFSINRCELTHRAREPIDYERAVAQHCAYEAALASLGCRVQRLPATPDLPDSVFVEDAAVVLDDFAILARPGAESRRREVETVAAALAAYCPIASIEAPGTLDGGDVLVTPHHVFVGISARTNDEGARQLAAWLAPRGIGVTRVPIDSCLHLKSAATLASDTLLVVNRAWVDASAFERFQIVDVDRDEPFAANVLRVGDHVLCAAEHPHTRARLEAAGLITLPVEAGELAKAEGGLTCCSLILRR
jgi:dimethylargininase